jgi:hypothetical protein
MNKEHEITELKTANQKLKEFHRELDEQVDSLLKKFKDIKEGLNAFLEIEQLNAQTLIEASEDHEMIKVKSFKDKVELLQPRFLQVWDNYNKQIGKIELLSLLQKEFETVFKVVEIDTEEEQ